MSSIYDNRHWNFGFDMHLPGCDAQTSPPFEAEKDVIGGWQTETIQVDAVGDIKKPSFIVSPNLRHPIVQMPVLSSSHSDSALSTYPRAAAPSPSSTPTPGVQDFFEPIPIEVSVQKRFPNYDLLMFADELAMLAKEGILDNDGESIGLLPTSVAPGTSPSPSPDTSFVATPHPSSTEDNAENFWESSIGSAKPNAIVLSPRFNAPQSEQWNERYQDLLEFKRHNGHCLVPYKYHPNRPLGQWVKRQRYQHKMRLAGRESTLSDERLVLLQEAGFVWDSHESVWDQHYRDLLTFISTHGHCYVPSRCSNNGKLGSWAKSQRHQYKLLKRGKASRLTAERMKLLDDVGFVWDPKCLMSKEKTRKASCTM